MHLSGGGGGLTSFQYLPTLTGLIAELLCVFYLLSDCTVSVRYIMVPGVWNSLVSQTFLYRVDVGKANPACRVLAMTNNYCCLSVSAATVQGTNTDVGVYCVCGPALD